MLPAQSRAPQHDAPFSTGTTLAAYGKWPQWPSLAACLVKLLSPRSSPGGTDACEGIVMCWLQCSSLPGGASVIDVSVSPSLSGCTDPWNHKETPGCLYPSYTVFSKGNNFPSVSPDLMVCVGL